MSQKSLLSFFNKSPASTKASPNPTGNAKPKPKEADIKKNESPDKDSQKENQESPAFTPKPVKKRKPEKEDEKKSPAANKRRRVIIESDSEEEYKPSDCESCEPSDNEEPMEIDDEITPAKAKKIPADGEGSRWHLSLDFLKPDKIMDKEKRKRTDEGYDARTLFVSPKFLNETTPAMRQWWELKVDHFDTVLFFKMGKFYEFFHMDADVGVKELGLIYMKGNYAHSGFPEIAYGRYADTLLRKGYKIARIEQVETPDMMNERVQEMPKKTKFDKVVKREVCQVTTPGTRTSNFLDGETVDMSSNYLLAVCEKVTDKGSDVGVAFVDTTVGKIHVGQFCDDIYGSRLRTLVAHYLPGQVLFEKKKGSQLLPNLFKTTLASVMKEGLVSKKEFWECEKTIKVLAESDYFIDEATKELSWPSLLKEMIADSDTVARTPSEGCELALRSLGALTWYMTYCFMDQEILSLRSFERYIPLDSHIVSPSAQPLSFENSRMVLDSVTLANLDILVNQTTGTTEGTLIERLDKCRTAGGKRLLREWLCAPLCSPTLIKDRLEAVTNLINFGDMNTIHSDVMRKLPDFERLLSRIHTLGHSKRSENHPDSRAIMFENVAYSKRKIDSFLSLLGGFKMSLDILTAFIKHKDSISSKVLKKCVSLKGEGGHFPDLQPLLDYFEEAFDHSAAKKAGAIHPSKGYVEEYDESVEEIDTIEEELQVYLKEQKKKLQCTITYVGTARNRYQMEMPEGAARRVPSHYEVTGQRKGYKRYITDDIKMMLARMIDAEEKKSAALKDTMRKIFHKFDESYSLWMDAVQCVSLLDVLISLAMYSSTSEGIMCQPEVISPATAGKSFIEIRDGRHPSAVKTFSGGDFIPNDTVIGIKDENMEDGQATDASLVLLTGPNMGGKSTLMRQVGLIAILAQMGCYVPAEKCRLTPVDRMFTRLGASDRIMHGESTFFVELSETSIILQHATQYSLVLLDELGRGTATHDGTAIASAVVKELAEYTKCRTIFSTHYHTLVDDFKRNNSVQLGHMACLVTDEEEEEDSTITFLYKFAPDFCPKSYGFNVARLAGLPEKVIKLGLAKTQELEAMTESRRCLRSILLAPDENCVQKVRSISVV